MDGKKVEIEELVDGDRVYGAMAAARAVGVLKVQCAQCGMVVEPQMHWDGQELLIYTYCLMPTRFVRVRAAYPASCRASLEDLKLRVDAALEMIEDGKAGGIVDSDRVYDAYRALVRAGLWESAAELDALVESDWPDFDDLMMGSRDEVDEGS